MEETKEKEKDKKIIDVKNLSLIYDIGKSNETLALKDINISIAENEYVILFGPSGCGKSTLLYTIAGLMTPTGGEIWINGKDITKMDEEEISKIHRTDLGIVFQAYNLVPTINIIDNVALPQTWRGIPKDIRYPIARKLLKRFGLAGQEKKFPQEMSGGQQQRASIARSLVNDAPIIIADEPTGNLDSKATKVVLDILSDLNVKEKKTIVMVTHDASMFEYADRIIFLKDGQVVKEERNPSKMKSGAEETPKTEEEVHHKKNQEFADAISDYFLNISELHLKDSLQKILVNRVENKISEAAFEELLRKPFRDGGIGLDADRINEIKKRISVILYEAELLKKKTAKELKYSHLSLEIGELRKYILEGFEKKLSFTQIKRLDETIGSFIHGAIDKEQFKKIVTLPEVQGGVGLSSQDSFVFISKLDLVLKLK